jgi:TonB family protein
MLDSTARAERIDLSASEAAYYSWEVAQKPVVVHLPMALIDRLESEAVESFRSLSSRGSEIGGVLLGSVTPGSPAIVKFTDFELIPCDYARGPLYRLAAGDVGRFEQTIAKHASGGGPRVIGYFRSHTRKGLSLDADDLAFFEPLFPEPQQVVLVIRPFAAKASTAGIFIRENGRIGGESSPLEFPFRSSELAARGAGEKSEPATLLAAPPNAAAPGRPQPRAQIVPIASRREITVPESVPAAKPEEAPMPAPAAPPQSQAAILGEKDMVEKRDREVKPETMAAAQAPAAQVLPAPSFSQATPDPARKNKKLRLMVAAAAAMVVIGGSLVVYPMLRKSISPRSPAVQQDSSALSLRVERTTGGMLLSWNRDLPAIQSASKVVLSISDGDRHENIQLDPNQVRTGSILYPPMTGDVSFQMEVTDPHQTRTTSESLRVLDPRPSPMADSAAAQPAATPGAPATTAAATPDASAAADESQSVEQDAAPHPVTPLKPFNTQSLAQRLRPATQTDLEDAPAMGRGSAATSQASLPGIVTSQPPLPAPPKAAPPANLPVGGQIQAAQVVTRVDPEYPKLARQAGAGGVVEVEATITVDGRVKNPHALHGNSMLQKAAIDAVMQWRYRPAMLNGKPVESPVQIKLNFVQPR